MEHMENTTWISITFSLRETARIHVIGWACVVPQLLAHSLNIWGRCCEPSYDKKWSIVSVYSCLSLWSMICRNQLSESPWNTPFHTQEWVQITHRLCFLEVVLFSFPFQDFSGRKKWAILHLYLTFTFHFNFASAMDNAFFYSLK